MFYIRSLIIRRNLVFRHKHPLPEADQTTAESVLVLVTVVVGRLDLHGHRVSGRLRTSLYIGKVKYAYNSHYIVRVRNNISLYRICV